jgi:TatD DNase family protein
LCLYAGLKWVQLGDSEDIRNHTRMIIDSHAHLDMPQFDADREAVVQRALDAGLRLVLTIGTGSPEGTSVEKTLRLIEKHDFLYAGIGIHPHDAHTADEA